ncbi:MAG TPA: NAD-dependent epimerase/dehydratase family protein, partial [Ramlibacter sp.]|nr:NAD-dependent epimerase/dehydratase family protein [Ramlibacter sp.]
MTSSQKIFVAGHLGMVGSAIVRCLRGQGCESFALRTRAEIDLTQQQSVNDFFA